MSSVTLAPVLNVEAPKISFSHRVFVQAKSATIILAIASAALAGVAFAYTAPITWGLATLTATIFNVYAIPKLMANGEQSQARTALVITLVVTGSLLVGGASASSFVLARTFGSSLAAMNMHSALWSSIAATGLIGYVIPAGLPLLKSAYTMLNDPSWKEKLIGIGEHLSQLPKVNQDPYESLLNSAFLIAALCKPDEFSLWVRNFQVSTSIEVSTVLQLLTSQNRIESFSNTLKIMKSLAPTIQNNEAGDKYRISFFTHLKASLSRMNDDEFNAAFLMLQESFKDLTPRMITQNHFLELFEGKLSDKLIAKCNEYLDENLKFNSINTTIQGMEDSLGLLEAQVEGHQADQKENLTKSLDVINDNFIKTRTQLEALYLARKRWVSFFAVPQEYISQLPVNIRQRLNDVNLTITPQNEELLSTYYQAAMGLNPNANTGLGGILNRKQRISGKLSKDAEEEQTSAWMFLGGNRCGFVMADYEILKMWLKVDSFDDIEVKLESIGLKNEEDLYTNKILPKLGAITKDEIKINLETYINNKFSDKSDLRTKIYNVFAGLKQIKASKFTNILSNATPALVELSRFVSKAVYRLATMGMILVPVLLFPEVAAVGFGIGLMYYATRRFGGPSAETLGDIFTGTRAFNRISTAMNFISGRNLLSLTPNARNNMNTFARADIFGKMRILNVELFATLAIVLARISDRGENIGIGGFLQGMALAREIAYIGA
ncbi:MAG: hypothetical protein H0W88_05380 [Parachlamydiaceae bacterium]|nr:hypothetical protein [Parachlamydiaceae bacterium]